MRPFLLVLLILTGPLGASAASPARPVHVIFQEVPLARFPSERPRELFPASFRTMVLDIDALQAALGETAPSISLLNPEGTVAAYTLVETPIMEEALARQYPEIRTFRGQGLTDPAETLILDVTPRGLHAMIFSPRGTILIDPLTASDNIHHMAYFKRDAAQIGKPFSCREQDSIAGETIGNFPAAVHAALPIASGESLKIYRTAIGVTGEYSAAVCAPSAAAVPCSLAAVVTALNRVNGILERDIAVRLVLVANENLLIYTNSATDPYTNNNLNTMLGENQSNLDAVIGTGNYDFGHVFGTAGGGTAFVNAVCNSSLKAQGATSLNQPLGDPFSVDYVSHEMGHQLGGRHSFNGTTDGCVFREAAYAYEPGSGSTLMAYAGLCGAEMIQLHHDDYYHVKSLDQMLAFLAGGGSSCGSSSPTGNLPPVASTTPSFTIPARTPFTLTGSATDANGDGLTYSWEEADLGAAAPPNDDVAAERPIFRSFPPALVPSRTFPRLSDLLNNTATLGESLPTRTRNMLFRFTVRDNRAGGGGLGFASTTVSVNAGAGPFAVTSPNTAVSWPALSSQTVTWNVANTTAAPVSCSAVSIALSANGGATYPYILAASTANDGSETVTATNLQTAQARVRVACAGNIFFDVSNANFSITGGSPVGSRFYTLPPCRLLDTRSASGPTGGLPISANSLVSFAVGGKCGVPYLTPAVSANVTVTQPATGGAFRLFAGDLALPTATTIFASAGQTRGNNAIVGLALDAAGTLKVKSDFAGSAHIIIDVNGYFQ